MESIDNVIMELPLGVSALVERQVNGRTTTVMIIKDDFREFIYTLNENQFHCKGALIKNNNIISGHMILAIEDEFDRRLYPFHFNYCSRDSLRLILNLSRQKRIYLMLCNKDNEYKYTCFKNTIKPFLRKYLSSCIKNGYQWSEEEYKTSIVKVISSFTDISNMWEKCGEEVYMNIIRR